MWLIDVLDVLVWVEVLSCYLRVSLSLDPPYIFFSFSQSLLLVGFLEISLKSAYLTIGIDGKRCRKIQKDIER